MRCMLPLLSAAVPVIRAAFPPISTFRPILTATTPAPTTPAPTPTPSSTCCPAGYSRNWDYGCNTYFECHQGRTPSCGLCCKESGCYCERTQPTPCHVPRCSCEYSPGAISIGAEGGTTYLPCTDLGRDLFRAAARTRPRQDPRTMTRILCPSEPIRNIRQWTVALHQVTPTATWTMMSTPRPFSRSYQQRIWAHTGTLPLKLAATAGRKITRSR